MQVLNPNNVKIYNLSCGKSLPEWISERKRRLLQKKNVDIRRRIELIQDFEMPGLSTGVKVSKDGQYIVATGTYKPRVRCYDVNELSMKFERCFNAEAVQFEVLTDDYSKMVFLQCDRYVEFHVRYGAYFRTRIPKFGRDLAYDQCSCDLYFVGASSEIYRYNLEQGRFLTSFQTEASSLNKCRVNSDHQLFVCGSEEGKVEAWDRRVRQRVGILDCAVSCVSKDIKLNGFPSVTSINFKGALTMAVGTETGQVLLYDLRANRPFLVKDHMYGLAIKNIDFIESEELIASMDQKCVKLWNQKTGKAYTAIQPPADLNDMCVVPNTGLLFLANEDKKLLTYFIPSIGPAPKWCSFLDSITEELEESPQETVYDDYKFVTTTELEELGLSHLTGTEVLRAHMHGYFIDVRLYNRAKSLVQPMAYKDFQKKKIKEKIEVERKKRIKTTQLPTVNKEMARHLMEEELSGKQNKKNTPSILHDERFKAMFENPDFDLNIDPNDEMYGDVRYLLNRMEKPKKKPKEEKSIVPYEKFQLVDDEDAEMKDNSSSTDEDDSESEEQSSEEENPPVKPQSKMKMPKMYEIKESEKFSFVTKEKKVDNDSLLPLEERLKNVRETFTQKESSAGSRVFTFTQHKNDGKKKREDQAKQHAKERAKYRRPAKHLRKWL